MTDQEEKLFTEATGVLDDRKQYAGKRVRVVRAVLLEGPYEDVARTLGSSLPTGTATRGNVEFTVTQGPIKVLDG